MSIDLYPAIDIRGGQCVRLRQGDYADETVYGSDPVAMAVDFATQGAVWIHVVDLDAARSGDPVNRSVVAAICSAVRGLSKVQTGGGVRTPADAEALGRAGVSRVVMGTAAVNDPSLVMIASAMVDVAVGLDHRDGEIAVHGWTQGSGLRLTDALSLYPTAAAFVITEIGRDGMLTGPDVEGLRVAVAATEVPVIASGGVSIIDDIAALGAINESGRRIGGVIAGKAIYEGRFTVAQGVQACALLG